VAAEDHSVPGAPPDGRLAKAVRRIVDAGAVIAAAAVVLMLVLVCIEVVMRQFHRSTMVADELAGYLNVVVVFLGMAYTLREGGFIRVELLYDRMSRRGRRAADLFSALVSLVFVVLLGWFLILHVAYAYQHDTRAVSVLQTPEWLPQTVMVLGCLVLAIQLAAYAVHRTRNSS
jgi:TRAP-type C4-dicarboxylate transport system permease small subunit